MKQTILDTLPNDNLIDPEQQLDHLAKRYRDAGGLGIQILNAIGGQADNLLDRLPKQVQSGLQDATYQALTGAMKAADKSRSMVPDQAGWLNTTLSTAMGAAGGIGGLPTALAELPVTVTILLRTIQGVAAEHGFDPATESVQFDCIEVFAAAGPLSADDGAEIGFVSARMALTGASLQALIARVAPKLGVVLGQKLAAQTVPLLGAVAGAATNYAYTSYYQEIAHVHFGLRKLAIEADIPHDELVKGLRNRMKTEPIRKGRA